MAEKVNPLGRFCGCIYRCYVVYAPHPLVLCAHKPARGVLAYLSFQGSGAFQRHNQCASTVNAVWGWGCVSYHQDKPFGSGEALVLLGLCRVQVVFLYTDHVGVTAPGPARCCGAKVSETPRRLQTTGVQRDYFKLHPGDFGGRSDGGSVQKRALVSSK